MKNSKNSKRGITLVALVITIIILLILSGISIATLTGSGLFEKARLAEQKSKNAQEKEQNIMSSYEELINTDRGNNNEIDYLDCTNGLKVKFNKETKSLEYYYEDKKVLPIYWYGFEPSISETLEPWYESGATSTITKKDSSVILTRTNTSAHYNYGGLLTSFKIDLSQYSKFHMILNETCSAILPQYLVHSGAFGTDWPNCTINYLGTIEKVENGPEKHTIDISTVTGSYHIGFSATDNVGDYDIAAMWLEYN